MKRFALILVAVCLVFGWANYATACDVNQGFQAGYGFAPSFGFVPQVAVPAYGGVAFGAPVYGGGFGVAVHPGFGFGFNRFGFGVHRGFVGRPLGFRGRAFRRGVRAGRRGF